IVGAGPGGPFCGGGAGRPPAGGWIGIAGEKPNPGGPGAAKKRARLLTPHHPGVPPPPAGARAPTPAGRAPGRRSRTSAGRGGPPRGAVGRGLPMLIEKPLATDLGESARVLAAIESARLDAVVGYTQRFRRRWLAAKEKCASGALGEVTMVTSRAFMNRLVAI